MALTFAVGVGTRRYSDQPVRWPTRVRFVSLRCSSGAKANFRMAVLSEDKNLEVATKFVKGQSQHCIDRFQDNRSASRVRCLSTTGGHKHRNESSSQRASARPDRPAERRAGFYFLFRL